MRTGPKIRLFGSRGALHLKQSFRLFPSAALAKLIECVRRRRTPGVTLILVFIADLLRVFGAFWSFWTILLLFHKFQQLPSLDTASGDLRPIVLYSLLQLLQIVSFDTVQYSFTGSDVFWEIWKLLQSFVHYTVLYCSRSCSCSVLWYHLVSLLYFQCTQLDIVRIQ